MDAICFGEIVVELKALREITGVEGAQTLNYLRASGCKRALILNFGATRLQVKRLVWTPRPICSNPSLTEGDAPERRR